MSDGMSDEPKKRSRAWIVWAIMAAVVLFWAWVIPQWIIRIRGSAMP